MGDSMFRKKKQEAQGMQKGDSEFMPFSLSYLLILLFLLFGGFSNNSFVNYKENNHDK